MVDYLNYIVLIIWIQNIILLVSKPFFFPEPDRAGIVTVTKV